MATPLLVFSDDWGRHPSSCQHLIRHLLPEVPVLWVNTIGMRRPRLDLATARRGLEKFGQWFGPRPKSETLPPGLTVLSPRMWPGFRTGFERRLNRAWVQKQL